MKINLKYSIYSLFRKLLSKDILKKVGKFPLVLAIKKHIKKFDGDKELAEGYISFENREFYFSAPYNTFFHAQKTGIEARITRVAISNLSNGAVALDVGANYGFITLLMAKSVFPNGKVLAFEPVLEICHVLEKSIERNTLSEICQLVPFPAGEREVDGFVTLDAEIERRNISHVEFIKIDVDGADYEVLLGANTILGKFHPIVVIEMHKNQEAIIDTLKAYGYKYMIGMQGEEISTSNYPPNLIASISPLSIPARGSLC